MRKLGLVFMLSLVISSCSTSTPSEAEMHALQVVSETNNNAKVSLTNENSGTPLVINKLAMNLNAVLKELPANPGIFTSDMATIFYKNLGKEKGIERTIICTITGKEGSSFTQKYTFNDLKNIQNLEQKYTELNVLLKQQKFEEIYALGSADFLKSIDKQKFLALLNGVEDKYGKLKSWQFIGWFEPSSTFITLHGLQRRDNEGLPFLVTLTKSDYKLINVQLGIE